MRVNRLTGAHRRSSHEGWALRAAGRARAAPLSAARPDLSPEPTRATASAARSSRSRGCRIGVDVSVRYALDPAQIVDRRRGAAGRRRARAGRADRRRRPAPHVRQAHGARDLLDQARRDPEGDRGRAQADAGADGIVVRRRSFIGNVDLPPSTSTGSRRCWPRSWRRRRCATRSSSRRSRSRRPSSTPRPTRSGARRRPRPRAQEQIIAAKSQEEAMKHVLPFKEKEIEQRRLEAEAAKVDAHQAGRGRRRGAPHRGGRRGRLAPQARRRRGVPHRGHRARRSASRWRARRR